MDSKRTRRVLIVAFVLSLLIHVVVATRVRWRVPVEREDETQIVRLDRMHQLPIARRTPPPATPTPAPRPSPARTAQAPKSARPMRPRGERAAGTGALAASAVPAASHTPGATPTPSCVTDVPAALASAPPVPDIPAAARAAQTSGIARVRVTLDETGAVREAAVVASTGNAALDAVATQMARAAQYAPAQHACKAVAGVYTFSVRFSAW